MGHGEGVEHRQVPVLTALFRGESPAIPDELVRGKFTPNQGAEAAGIMLGRRDGKATPDAALAHLAEQRAFGHMSAGPDGPNRNEIFPPAPHSILWYLPLSCIGLWAKGDLRAAVVQWWADHFALVGAFWTPRGLAAPCGRFKWPTEMKPIPDWTLDNLMYSAFRGIAPPAGAQSHDATMDAFGAMLRQLGDEIRAATPDPIVAVPIAKWPRAGGGYLAAFAGRPPMNDPLGRVEVDGDGAIVDAQKLPGDLPPLADAVLIGRAPGSAAGAPPAPASSAAPSPVAVTTTAPPAPASGPAEMLAGLTLGHKAAGLRALALAALAVGDPAAAAAFVRPIRANINPGQFPAVEAILAALGRLT